MAYDRTGTGPWVWIKTVGSVEDQLEDDWLDKREYLLKNVWFPKHPRSLREGDLLVYYAAGRKAFPAVVQITSDRVHQDESHPTKYARWPWSMEVRERAVVTHLPNAPTLADSGIEPRRLRRQSHIVLTDAEWEHFRDLFVPAI